MLAVAALGLFASGPGQSHIFSVFIAPISEDLGVSRTSVASAYAFATLVAALGLPYVGRLIDRFGARHVVLAVALLFGAAAMAFGQVANLFWLTVGFGALRFLGQGSLMLNCANLVAQWFDRQRGFALSLMALGFAASMAVHPPLAQWLSDQVGWREAWLWLGVLTWMLLIPPILLLIQNKPEDLGLEPDGRGRRGPGLEAAAPQGAEVGLTVKQALRTPAFWITALSLATLSMLVTALFFHQVSIFTHQGVDAYVAARVFSVSAITMVLAMPIIGRLLDRFPTKPIFACAMLTQSAALIAIVFVDDLTSAVALRGRVRPQQRCRPDPLHLCVAALLRAPAPRQHPGHGPDHRHPRRLGRTAAVRRGVRPVRQLHGRAPGLCPAAGAVRDRHPPHAAAAPGQSRRRRARDPGPLSAGAALRWIGSRA